MKKIIPFFALIVLLSCSKDYKFDENDFNIFSGIGRTNSYEQFGKFAFQIVSSEPIESNDSSGVIQTAIRLKNPYSIIANSKGKILRINNTTVDKTFSIDSNFVVASGMCADKNSNIYFISSNDELYCIDFNLELKWKKDIQVKKSHSLSFSDLIATNSGVIVGANTGELLKYNFDGEIAWKYESSLAIPKTFAADSLDYLYIPITNNEFGATDSLACIDNNGKLVWQTELKETRVLSSSAYRNGRIYISGAKLQSDEKTGITFCLDRNGKILWKNEIPILGRFVSVDYDNNCYVLATSSGIGEIKSGAFAYNNEGKEIWNVYLGAAATSPLIISQKYLGFTAFTGEGAAMYFIRKDDGLMVKFHSLANFPPLYLQAYISDDCSIKLFGSSKLTTVKFSETLLNKLF